MGNVWMPKKAIFTFCQTSPHFFHFSGARLNQFVRMAAMSGRGGRAKWKFWDGLKRGANKIDLSPSMGK